METFKYQLLIRERHLDTFGHMNNATYLEILEEARWEFISGRGFGVADIAATRQGPIVLGWTMKFVKELRLRQNIVVESETLSYQKKVGVLRQDILNEQGELCFEGRMTFGLFDIDARKLIAPTPQWLSAIGWA